MQASRYNVLLNDKGESLVYYPCKKNANSSAKLFLIKHLGNDEKVFFIEDDVPRHMKQLYHNTANKNLDKINLITTFPVDQQFEKIEADYKCCIIRNPIKRFISAYKNRILYHKDEEFKDHSVDLILEKLLLKKFENKHFLPQNFFLGNDLSYFTFYSDVENIQYFENRVNNFFGKKIEFPKIQTGGNSFKVELSKKQLNLIEKIYEDDFKLYFSDKKN